MEGVYFCLWETLIVALAEPIVNLQGLKAHAANLGAVSEPSPIRVLAPRR